MVEKIRADDFETISKVLMHSPELDHIPMVIVSLGKYCALAKIENKPVESGNSNN